MKSIKQKRNEAQQRAADRAKRSPQQQIAILAKCPGDSAKERARLAKVIELHSSDKLTPHGEVAKAPKPVKAKKHK